MTCDQDGEHTLESTLSLAVHQLFTNGSHLIIIALFGQRVLLAQTSCLCGLPLKIPSLVPKTCIWLLVLTRFRWATVLNLKWKVGETFWCFASVAKPFVSRHAATLQNAEL